MGAIVMTRDQDFEQRLSDHLTEGPSVAPKEVVDQAVERTEGRRQRHRAWVWLTMPLDLPLWRSDAGRRLGRLVVIAAVMASVLLTALLISGPFAGGPGPVPEMESNAVRSVGGSMATTHESEAAGVLERVLLIEVGDPRIDGTAHQSLRVENAPAAGVQRSTGVMRLDNDWGTWEGVVNGVRFPDGTIVEYGWLTGRGAYDGFSYFHSTHGPSAGTERAIEGAIWPGEPPSMPDPSLLP